MTMPPTLPFRPMTLGNMPELGVCTKSTSVGREGQPAKNFADDLALLMSLHERRQSPRALSYLRPSSVKNQRSIILICSALLCRRARERGEVQAHLSLGGKGGAMIGKEGQDCGKRAGRPLRFRRPHCSITGGPSLTCSAIRPRMQVQRAP
jgi:hypothetical protein